jgi:hypothetical protein
MKCQENSSGDTQLRLYLKIAENQIRGCYQRYLNSLKSEVVAKT